MEKMSSHIPDNDRLQQLAKEQGIMGKDLKLPGMKNLKPKGSKLEASDLNKPYDTPILQKPEEIDWDKNN